MGGLFSAPKIKTPPLPKPEPPVAMPEKGVMKQRKTVKAGRGGTIYTGQMAPANIFKKRLLG